MNVKHECYGKVHRLLKGCRLIEPRIKRDMWIVWVGSTNSGEARLFEFDYYEDEGAAKAAGAAMRDSEYHEDSEHYSRLAAVHHHDKINLQQCKAICAKFEVYMKPASEEEDDETIGSVLKDFELSRINDSSGEAEKFTADCTIVEHSGGRDDLYTLEFELDHEEFSQSMSRVRVEAALEKQNNPELESNEDAAISCTFAPITGLLCAELPGGAEMGRDELSAREVHEVARLAGLNVPATTTHAMRHVVAGQEAKFWTMAGMQAMAVLEAALLIPYEKAGKEIASPLSVARAAEVVKKLIKPAARPEPTAVGSAPKTVRYDALRMRVPDDGEWTKAVKAIVQLAEPSRAELINAYDAMQRGCVERFLSRFKDRTEPLVLSVGPDLDMGACMALILQIEAETEKAPTGDKNKDGERSSVNPRAWTGARGGDHFRETTGTEVERREKMSLRQDAVKVDNSPALQNRLSAMAGSQAGGDIQGMFELVKAEKDPALTRLLEAGSDLNSLEGKCSSETMMDVQRVTTALELRLEKMLLGDDYTPSTDQRAAIRAARLGKLSSVKLLALLGQTDKGTEKDPLKSFADHVDPATLFARAISRLTLLLQMANPHQSATTAVFMDRLSTVVGQEYGRGVPWDTISKHLYKPAITKAAYSATIFAIDETAERHATLEVKWIDGPTTYRRDYDLLATKAVAEAAGQKAGTSAGASACDKLSASIKARRVADPADDRNNSLKRKRKKKGKGNPPQVQNPKGTGKRALKRQAQATAASKTAESSSDSDSDSSSSDKAHNPRLNKTPGKTPKELLAAYGKKDGKLPCTFFFNGNNCRFDEDKCRMHHQK